MRKIMLLLVCVLLAMPVVGQTTLNAAGATFPYPIYSKWFSEYHKLHSEAQFITSGSRSTRSYIRTYISTTSRSDQAAASSRCLRAR